MRKLILSISASSLLIAGGATWLWIKKNDNLPTAMARKGDLVEAVYGLGTVTAQKTYEVKLGVTQRLAKLLVRQGDKVQKGAPLLVLDDAVMVRAPFGGVVTSLPFRQGETVYPQTSILTLVDLEKPYVAVSLEQEGALRVRVDQVVKLSFESIHQQTFVGRVRTIFPKDGQFIVHIDVANLPSSILPGMTADVAVEIARRADVFMVPAEAFLNGSVAVLRDGHVKKVPIQVGAADGQWLEVTKGDVSVSDVFVIREK